MKELGITLRGGDPPASRWVVQRDGDDPTAEFGILSTSSGFVLAFCGCPEADVLLLAGPGPRALLAQR